MDQPVGVLPQILIDSLHQTCLASQKDIPIASACVDSQWRIHSLGENRVEREHNPLLHAEMVAIQKLSQQQNSRFLDQWVLVSTLEPCTMCMGAIGNARMKGLVFFLPDDKSGYFRYHNIVLPENQAVTTTLGTHSIWVRYMPKYQPPFLSCMTHFFANLRNQNAAPKDS